MDLTKAQQTAIDLRGRTLLISAAAGSGKTFTLTQRIIKSIIEKDQDISRLLIVTFTRAAAGELKAKITKALNEAIENDPENPKLQAQLLKLSGAHISTIDSFFAEPVRANFEKLDLPASMRLSDDAELDPLRNRIMRDVLDSYFEACAGLKDRTVSDIGYSDDFTELMGMLSSARDTSAIAETLLAIYRKLMTAPEGIDRLRAHSERLRKNASIDFLKTEEGEILRNEMLSVIGYTAATFEKCCAELEKDGLLKEKYLPTFLENHTLCVSLEVAVREGSYTAVRQAFEKYKPSSIPQLRNDKTEISEYYKDLRGKKLNPGIKELAKKYLCHTPEELSELYLRSAKVCDLMIDILHKYDEKYSEEKRTRSICEFSDMPRFMITLLQNSDGTPTDYAYELSQKFDEVYIDEYQDVNDIQDTIFRMIGGSHRFMVGDIKQSIYGFREAEPAIFANYREKFAEYDAENDVPPSPDSGNTVFMSENFRCDENVIKFTNLVCSRIFSVFKESIDYKPSDDLVFKKEKPSDSYASPKVTLNIIQSPEESDESEMADSESDTDTQNEDENAQISARYDEAVVTANEIARLVREEKKADGTPIRFGDIAVLVRSHSSAAPLINELNALNVKYVRSSSNDVFESRDMKLLIDLLSAIDNPREDIPLCNVITAQISSEPPPLTLEETVVIRKQISKSRALYDALSCYSDTPSRPGLEEKCRAIVSHIEELRRAAAVLSADKLLRVLCHSEFFAPLCRTDAYNYLYDRACRYVMSSWNGLYSFLCYFKKLMEKGESGSEPQRRDPDAVSIMSIHQSKGLEFPVCFLFKTDGQFNLSDTKGAIVFSRELGLSMKLPPAQDANEDILSRLKVRYRDNAIRKAADIKIKQRQIEEEARLFYVALTRARERLYLSATINTTYEDYTARLSDCADKSFEIKKGKSYFRQTMLVLSDEKEDLGDIFEVKVFTKGEISLAEPFSAGLIVNCDQAELTPEESYLAGLLEDGRGESESEKLLANIPAKVAASKVTANMLDNSIFIPTPTGMLFSDNEEDAEQGGPDNAQLIKNRIKLMRSKETTFDSLLEINKKPTAAEIGTATHEFLEFCDYKNASENGIEAEIERLLSLRFISERSASIIKKKQLQGFFKSSLFSLILQAKSIRREFHFGMFKDAALFTEDEKLREIVAGKKIYVQGSIDLLLETPEGEIVLCDYKTDRISSEEKADRALLIENMKKKHLRQLEEYSYATEQIFGKKPSKIYIYSVTLGEVIEM